MSDWHVEAAREREAEELEEEAESILRSVSFGDQTALCFRCNGWVRYEEDVTQQYHQGKCTTQQRAETLLRRIECLRNGSILSEV